MVVEVKAKDVTVVNDSGMWQLALGVVMAVAAAIATYVNLKLKGEILALKSEHQTAMLTLANSVEAKLSNSASALENKIFSKLDGMEKYFREFERNFGQSFVPMNLSKEQMQSVLFRVEATEKEVKQNRERIHDSQKIWAEMANNQNRMQDQFTDNARRMAAYEERDRAREDRGRTQDDRLRDLEEGQEELRRLLDEFRRKSNA